MNGRVGIVGRGVHRNEPDSRPADCPAGQLAMWAAGQPTVRRARMSAEQHVLFNPVSETHGQWCTIHDARGRGQARPGPSHHTIGERCAHSVHAVPT